MSDRLIYDPRSALRCAPRRAFASDRQAFVAGCWFLAINGHEKATAWCYENGISIARVQSEGTNVAGGFIVPDELARTIIDVREQRGAFRAAAQVFPMSRESTSVPRRAGGLTAYFTSEGAAITESNMSWDNINLVAKKLAAFNRTSTELDEDAAIDLGDEFAFQAGYAFASKEDDCGFNGDGTSAYGGIRGVTVLLLDGTHDAGKVVAATGHDTFAEIDAVDLANLVAKLPAIALPGARWFCSQFAFAMVFCRLAMSAGGILVLPVNGRPMPHFMGFPVQLTQVLPQVGTDLSGQVMLLFGDLQLAATLGERRGMTVARSELGQTFTGDQVAWRCTERVDINVHDLGDNTTAGPIVGLVGE